MLQILHLSKSWEKINLDTYFESQKGSEMGGYVKFQAWELFSQRHYPSCIDQGYIAQVYPVTLIYSRSHRFGQSSSLAWWKVSHAWGWTERDFEARCNLNHPGILQADLQVVWCPWIKSNNPGWPLALNWKVSEHRFGGIPKEVAQGGAVLRVLLGFRGEGGINTSSSEHQQLGKQQKTQAQANS